MTNREIRAKWMAQLFSTDPSDRPRAEAAVRRLYTASGFGEPKHLLWYDSPCAASWPVAALVAEGNPVWMPLLSPGALSRDDKERLDQARTNLARLLGVGGWKEAVAAAGRPRVGTLLMVPDPSYLFTSALLDARAGIVEDIGELFVLPPEDDELQRAESHFWGGNHGVLRSSLHCPTTGSVIGNSWFHEYSFSTMADDEMRIGSREAPVVLAAAGDAARSLGMFWPFEDVAFLCDRPAELHVNDKQLVHNANGPAIVYRDGWKVFAWNGKAVPDRWITDPGSVPPREYKGFDPSYAAFAGSRSKTGPSPARRVKQSAIQLPSDHVQRLEALRTQAGGSLPFFERYQRGEHREVWAELVSLGEQVRDARFLPDALAVAYETMTRVEQNVRTLVNRLVEIEYAFTPDGPGRKGLLGSMFGAFSKPGSRVTSAHVSPTPDVSKRLASFEKEFGTLPLSLRTFYEVVGEVNLMGTHSAIDPNGNPVAPDPLVVHGFDEGIVEFDDEDESPTAVTIAPDDLHKADTSGGDPYEMRIPDLRADGELLNERHNLFFVEYLRLVFAHGGFPGYEGRVRVPAELEWLKAGLLEF
jgi:hypothetical protein